MGQNPGCFFLIYPRSHRSRKIFWLHSGFLEEMETGLGSVRMVSRLAVKPSSESRPTALCEGQEVT